MKFVEITLHRRCTSVRFSIQHPRTLGRPSRAGEPNARPRWSAQGTRLVGRSVSRWYQISHAIQVRRFIHLGDAHSKLWAALNASVSIPCWRTWQHPPSTKYICGLSIGINVLPGFWHIIWACGYLRVRLIVEILRYTEVNPPADRTKRLETNLLHFLLSFWFEFCSGSVTINWSIDLIDW